MPSKRLIVVPCASLLLQGCSTGALTSSHHLRLWESAQLAAVHAQMSGDDPAAIASFQSASIQLKSIPLEQSRRLQAWTLLGMSESLIRSGRREDAIPKLKQVLAISGTGSRDGQLAMSLMAVPSPTLAEQAETQSEPLAKLDLPDAKTESESVRSDRLRGGVVQAQLEQDLQKARSNADYKTIVSSLNDLYWVYTHRKANLEALKCLFEAVKIARKHFGEDSPEYRRSAVNLGYVLVRRGRDREAVELLAPLLPQLQSYESYSDQMRLLASLAWAYREVHDVGNAQTCCKRLTSLRGANTETQLSASVLSYEIQAVLALDRYDGPAAKAFSEKAESLTDDIDQAAVKLLRAFKQRLVGEAQLPQENLIRQSLDHLKVQ